MPFRKLRRLGIVASRASTAVTSRDAISSFRRNDTLQIGRGQFSRYE
jgi:hypothetical protein